MRISTTTLESFRLFMTPDQEWMSEAELVASIRGEFVPNAKVLLGKAFGEVIETPDAFRVPGGYRHGDLTFDDDVMAPALALFDRRGVFEAKATKQYGPHTVVAKADQLLGAQLIENKTTSLFNFDKYADSYQWRFMCDIFEPLRVTYHVFCLDQDEHNGVVRLRGIETFDLYPYPGLHADCCALLTEFAAYAARKGLDGFLRERQERLAVTA